MDVGDDDDGVVSDGSTTTMVYPPTSPLANGNAGVAVDDALTHQFLAYDSKQETGMVGLKNQGATCYMNSLLQTLFHLRAFRQVVYDTPSEKEDTNDSVSLALQRVFYRLQTQSKAVSTKELTRSFGWSQIDSFMQHDVQELYRILCDRLEEKMKNTKVDSAIKRLFEGKVRSFVQCVNVEFQSFRDESFYDLQLDVKGCKDIYESFRKYVEIEMLQGDNQYEAEGYGKQDAKKGIRFLQFPPVLNIQLKRFEYDPLRDGMVKIHDRFEFPKTLVLDDFISSSSDAQEKKENSNSEGKKQPSGSHVYHLHSVLVHSGDVHGGHYYVFIRPGKDIAQSSNWFKFDDDQISCVDEQTAIEGNYGSGSPGIESGPSTPLYSSMLCSPEASSNGNMDFRRADAIPDPDRGADD
uniref:Ubiquitin carboxyl-terminal hydrolase n=1 Tax=Globisporangium ultimum (strain ATCC 200006 / CBS 805.95 / DAOM BR144) TaxID=431595 RepID=K3WE28_GLOUD